MATVGQAPRPGTADGSWMLWTAAGIVGIWTAVVVVSLLAPDLVSGSEQEHLPLAAMTCWLWGLLATGSYLAGMARLRGSAARRPLWVGLTVGVLVVWLVATVLAVTLPRYETGSDPTRVPLGAVLVPLAAAVVTTLAGIVATVFARPPEAG